MTLEAPRAYKTGRIKPLFNLKNEAAKIALTVVVLLLVGGGTAYALKPPRSVR